MGAQMGAKPRQSFIWPPMSIGRLLFASPKKTKDETEGSYYYGDSPPELLVENRRVLGGSAAEREKEVASGSSSLGVEPQN